MKEYTYNFHLYLFTIFIYLNIGTLAAQQKKISFETDEGTWMALDVSPDGNTINFELLGDIYNLPIEGGTAEPLIEGNDETDPFDDNNMSPELKQIMLEEKKHITCKRMVHILICFVALMVT